jgi:hypothetical protein
LLSIEIKQPFREFPESPFEKQASQSKQGQKQQQLPAFEQLLCAF